MIKIIKAKYGGVDVSKKLQTLVNSNKKIHANNDTFGDTNKNIRKVLIVDYIEDNVTKHIVVKERGLVFDSNTVTTKPSTIEFIIPTYNRVKQLYVILSSLVAQIDDNWKATIVVDDVENNRVKDIVSKFDSKNIHYMFLGKRYNDWGHTPRNIGKQASSSDYIILTGDDNYYVPTFISELNQIISNEKVGLIYWDMIHNGYNYKHFNTRINDGYIDMGAFATRRDLSQQIDLTKSYSADSKYVKKFIKNFPDEKIVKIKKILFVHN